MQLSYSSPSQELLYKLHQTTFLLDKLGDHLLHEQKQVSFSQFLILMAIEHHPDATQCTVARFLGITQAAVSRQVDNLVSLGLLTRQENAVRRSENILSLTSAGKTKLCGAQELLEKKFETLTLDIPTDEVAATLRLLDRLLGHLRQNKETICETN